jgi:hypothetical protein
MTKPKCLYCSRYVPLTVSGMCVTCEEDMKRYHARTADFCVNAPCLTPNACGLAKRCRGFDDETAKTVERDASNQACQCHYRSQQEEDGNLSFDKSD